MLSVSSVCFVFLLWGSFVIVPISCFYHKMTLSSNVWPSLFNQQIALDLDADKSPILCASLCSSSSLDCNTFLVRDGQCFLGNVPSGNQTLIEPQTQDADVYINRDATNRLSSLLQSVGGVKSKLIWLRNMVGYTDLQEGGTEYDCFFHCSTVLSNCEIVVVEFGRCHYGTTKTSTLDTSVLKDDTAPWEVFFTNAYSTLAQERKPRSEILGVPASIWSLHTYVTTVTNQFSNCVVFCYLHAKYRSPCTFYVYLSQTNMCYLGDINNMTNANGMTTEFATVHTLNDSLSGDYSPNRTKDMWIKNYFYGKYLYKITGDVDSCAVRCHFDVEERCSFAFTFETECFFGDVFQTESNISFPISNNVPLPLFLNRELKAVTDVPTLLFVEIQSPLRIWAQRVFDPKDSFDTLAECATACMIESFSVDGSMVWGCHFVHHDPTDGSCQMGNLDYNQHNSTLTSDVIYSILVRKDILDRYAGQDFDQSSYNSSWNKYMYQAIEVDPVEGFQQCSAYCILDFGPCSITVLDSTNSKCYLADWYIDSELYLDLPTFSGQVLYRYPKLGAIVGGRYPNGDHANDTEVLTEESSVCSNHAIPPLPIKVHRHAVLFASSINMLMSCGGAGNVAQDDCYGLYLDDDIPTWITLQKYPNLALTLALVEVGANIYGIGGFFFGVYSSKIFNYDIDNDNWVAYDDAPLALSTFGVTVFQGEVWIMGGTTSGKIEVKGTHVWNPLTKTWRNPGSISSNLPYWIKSFACGLMKDKKTGHDWILVVGGHSEENPVSPKMFYFDIQDNTQWKAWKAKVPMYGVGTNILPGGWNGFAVSPNSLFQFGASKLTIATGLTTSFGESENNVALWQDELGLFVWSSKTLTIGRKFAGLAHIPLHTRWTCFPMGYEWEKMVEQTSGHFFLPGQISGYASPLFSNLEYLDNFRSCSGHYHFRLVWPELGYFNEWVQANDIREAGPVLGFQKIAVKYVNNFGGLFHVGNGNANPGDPDHTFAKGDTRPGGANFAVGRFSGGTGNSIPGPVGRMGNININVDHLILYIKKDCE